MNCFTRAFSSLGCPELSLDQTLDLAQRHKIEAVELRTLDGTTDLPALFKKKYGTPDALSTHVRRSPVRVAVLDTSLKLIGSTEADREAFLAFVPWAEALSVPHLRVFDGGESGGGQKAELTQDVLGWWRSMRERNGWRTQIIVETHDALTTTPAILEFARVAPGIGILWDAHHTWKKGGEDPVTTWEAIKHHVVHVHVKDSVSRPSARHPFTYVLPGDGEFPMAPLVEALRRDFNGTLSLEWERQWHPYLPPLEEALVVAAGRKWW